MKVINQGGLKIKVTVYIFIIIFYIFWSFVTDIINIYYGSEEAVCEDLELKAFVKDIFVYGMRGNKDSGDVQLLLQFSSVFVPVHLSWCDRTFLLLTNSYFFNTFQTNKQTNLFLFWQKWKPEKKLKIIFLKKY